VGGEVGLFVEDESTGLNWLFGVEHLDVSNWIGVDDNGGKSIKSLNEAV
jgi:hypothetical protein